MIALEHLADGSVSDRNFQKLMSLVIDTGGLSVGIRFGSGTVTWAGATPFATVSVTHGLGATPKAVMICDNGLGTLAQIAVFSASAGATTFTAAAEPTDSSSPAASTTRGFYWVAVG